MFINTVINFIYLVFWSFYEWTVYVEPDTAVLTQYLSHPDIIDHIHNMQYVHAILIALLSYHNLLS